MFLDLEINSTKTLNDFLNENPGFYNSVVGFAFNNASGQWEQTGIDPIMENMIFEHFFDRYICDDDRFGRLYRARLNQIALQWAQMRRLELSAFDPMVANYVEKEIREDNNRTKIGNTLKEETNAGSTTRNIGGTRIERSNGQTNGSSDDTFTPGVHSKDIEKFTPRAKEIEDTTTTPSGKQITKDTRKPQGWKEITEQTTDGFEQVEQVENGVDETFGREESIAKAGAKSTPQSIQYQNANGGTGPNVGNNEFNGSESKLPDFDWQYLTSQEQHDGESGRHEKTTHDQGIVRTERRDPKTERSFIGQDITEHETEYQNYNENVHKEITNEGYDKRETDHQYVSGTERRHVVDSQIRSDEKNITDSKNDGETRNGLTSGETQRNDAENESNRQFEIMTGRNGLTPQEAFQKATTWIKRSSAWTWLEREIDSLFMRVTYNPND